MVGLDDTEQRPAEVDDEQLRRVRGVRRGRSRGTESAARPSFRIRSRRATMRCASAAKSTAIGLNSALTDTQQISVARRGHRAIDASSGRARPASGSSSTGGATRPPYRVRNLSAVAASNVGTAMASSRPSRVMPRPGGLCGKLPGPPDDPFRIRPDRPAATRCGCRSGPSAPAGSRPIATPTTTTWMPYESPWAARAVIDASSASNS